MMLRIAEENRIFMSQTHIMSLMTIQFNMKFQSNRTFSARMRNFGARKIDIIMTLYAFIIL